jgi:crotonobetainyl-CoA:carnitine CoA-transferase CaiB-like acyl-CoA transferase
MTQPLSPQPSPAILSSISRPLDGVRVVDLTSVLMGPAATQILADYGADVIKVESPEGDIMRHAGYMKHRGMGPVFLHANRNKRSIAIDLKCPGGCETLLEMIAASDLFVHNVRPAALARLGIDGAALVAEQPRLICLALVGFGQRGPYAPLPAVDDAIQGASGMASLVAQQTGGEPAYAPMVIVDRLCAVSAAQSALAALFMRTNTGRGQYIEVPMFETAASFVLGDHMGGETFDPPVGPTGYSRLLARDRRPFRTKDGHVALLVYTDGQWQRFFEAIGEPEVFRSDARLTTAAVRAQNYDFSYALLTSILVERTSSEWVALLQRCDIPCMPLHDPHSLLSDPHLAQVGFFDMIDHPTEGRMRSMNVAARWSDADLSVRRHAPQIGEHTVEVLREFGFDQARIARLLAGGTIKQANQPSERAS